MKSRFPSFVSILLAALLLMSACTSAGSGGSATDITISESNTISETESQTETEPQTETETETEGEVETSAPVETEPNLTLTANTLVADGDKIVLNLSCDFANDQVQSELICMLSDENGTISEKKLTATAGISDIMLDCPSDRIDGTLTITVDAVGTDGQAEDSLTLTMKQKAPQLSADAVKCVVAAMTLEEKASLVAGTQNKSRPDVSGTTYAIPRLGIPSIVVNDGPAGVRYGTSIWYPSEINVASSWDVLLARDIGVSMAEDSLAKDIDIILAPGMNIQKNILCGRNFEYLSEDPILTALMAGAYTDGIQSKGVGVAIKHFVANNQEVNRGTVSSTVTERALREIYLKAFGMVVQSSDPYTVMSSYNKLNGQYTSTRYDLLTKYLRGEVGFNGFVMSDWGSAGEIDEKVNAGNDINMPGYENDPEKLITAYNAGRVDPLMLEAACRSILGVVVRCHSFTDPDQKVRLDSANHRKQVESAAADTMVLLQNNGSALPLANGTTVALFGNGAVHTVYGGAGSGSVSAQSTVSIMEGLKRTSGVTVFDANNSPFLDCQEHSATEPSNDVVVTEAYAKTCADGADVAVIVISRGSAEGSDRSPSLGDYKLNQTEQDMIARVSEAFHAKGKRVVVLLNVSSPIEIVSWRDSVDAILWIGYPGEQAGKSVANVLLGKVNPSAKTTITWPVSYESTPAVAYFPGNAYTAIYYEDIYVGYRYYETFGVDVAYPFGYGLSYTQFEYSDFSIQKQADGSVIANVTVKNSGSVEGREIVQIYVSKPEATLEQASRELAGFGKTKLLAPGESETLTIVVPVDALTSYDTEQSRYFIDKGTFTFHAGASSADTKLTAEVTESEVKVTKDVENIAPPHISFDYIRKDTYTVPTEGEQVNIAKDKVATDNGHEGNLAAGNAVDGDSTTRWSGYGAPVSTHELTVDLGEACTIGRIVIYWESIQGSYTLLTSEDGVNYNAVGTYEVDESHISIVNPDGQNARYVKINVKRGGFCSIYELQVYSAV